MNKKKDSKTKAEKVVETTHKAVGEVSTESDLKALLLNVRDKLVEQSAAPIFAVATMNQILISPEVYSLLNDESKEIARDIWLRIKQSGFQVSNPPMLFGQPVDGAVNPTTAA